VNGLALDADRINKAMGATDMVLGTGRSSFVDNSNRHRIRCRSRISDRSQVEKPDPVGKFVG